MTRPFIPAENTVRIQLVYLYQGRRCINTWWAQYGFSPSYDRLERLGDNIDAWIADDLRFVTHVGCGFEKLDITDMTSEGGTFYERTTFQQGFGLLTGTGLPLNVSLVVRWNTGLAGRSRRGRTFLVGMPASALDGSSPSFVHDEYRDDVQARFETLKSVIETASGAPIMCVASFMEDGAWRAAAQLTPITTVEVNRRIDSMRKRMPA